jgi:uncharacterized protein
MVVTCNPDYDGECVSMAIIGVFLFALSVSFLSEPLHHYTTVSIAYAQPYVETVKHRDLTIDLGNGLKTNAQLTIPAVGEGPFPGVLLIHGSGANDLNETRGLILVDNKTGTKIYPDKQTFFQLAEYLSERGFAVLKYDKRGVTSNFTILDSNVWGNLTLDDLVQDAGRALAVLIRQPEVDADRITVLGHSEGTMISPLIAIKDPDKVDNVVLMGVVDNQTKIFEFQTVDLPLLYLST